MNFHTTPQWQYYTRGQVTNCRNTRTFSPVFNLFSELTLSRWLSFFVRVSEFVPSAPNTIGTTVICTTYPISRFLLFSLCYRQEQRNPRFNTYFIFLFLMTKCCIHSDSEFGICLDLKLSDNLNLFTL